MMKGKMMTKDQYYQHLEQENLKLKEEKDKLIGKYQQLEEIHDKYYSVSYKQGKEIIKLKKENKKMKFENSAFIDANEGLAEKNKKLQEERDQLVDVMGNTLTLKDEYDILEHEYDCVKEEYSILEAELEDTKERNKILGDEDFQKRVCAAEQGCSLFAHEAEVWEMRFDASKERNKILEEENEKADKQFMDVNKIVNAFCNDLSKKGATFDDLYGNILGYLYYDWSFKDVIDPKNLKCNQTEVPKEIDE